jgi:hypothetical protein
MPGCARKEIVRKGQPGIFHCWSRCVRRAFLLGTDPLTGTDHNHRRQWVLDRLELLTANFAIDVAYLAVMSNHLHLVLRVTPRLVDRMGDHEVARRWLRVYPGRRVLDGNWIEPTEEQIQALVDNRHKMAIIRGQLSDVSWFMSALCEYIARRSNAEDGCTGRFWEGRFGCREVTCEEALLIAGIYVDLNQIRAGEATCPEDSYHCSVSLRLRARALLSDGSDSSHFELDGWLAPLTLQADQLGDVPSSNGRRASDKGLLSMSLEEYVKLLDWAGREVRADKQGAIPPHLEPILERLGITSDEFVETVTDFPGRFRRLAGRSHQIRARAKEVGRRWLHGVSHASRVFRKSS